MLTVKVSQEFHAQLCSADFYFANVSANVSVSDSSTSVMIDPKEFSRNRKQMDGTHYKISDLEAAFQTPDPDWSTKFLSFRSNTTRFAGPLLAMAASSDYNNNATGMITDTNFLKKATGLYQQFLGEMLLLALNPSVENSRLNQFIIGTAFRTERRIVANPAIGVVLGTLLIVSGCCVSLVAYKTALSRRVLNLHGDPGQIGVVTSLLAKDEKIRAELEGTDELSKKDLIACLSGLDFYMRPGRLLAADCRGSPDKHRRHNILHLVLVKIADR